MASTPAASRPVSASDKHPRVTSSPARSQSSTAKLEPPPPTPAYDVSAHLIQPSPLMTSSLHSRDSATSVQESSYLRQAKYLRWTRALLSLLSIAGGLAAVACEGHVLHRYNSTHPGSDAHLPSLWPSNVDVRPNIAILTTGCVMVAVSIVFLVVSLIPTPYSRTLFYNFLFLATSLTSLALAIFALPFANLLTGFRTHHQRESIQSWTCKFSTGASNFMHDAKSLQIPVYTFGGIPIPAGFQRLCNESKAGQGLMALLLAVAVVSCATAIAGLFVERSMTKKRANRYAEQGEKGEVVS